MKKKKYIDKCMIVIIMTITIIFPTYSTFAGSLEDVGYDIQPILPENQVDDESTYFDLKMTPGQKQKLELLINNTSDEKSTYEISINQAYTNEQGYIDYSKHDVKLDESLIYDINNIVTYEHEVTVEAKQFKKYSIGITMPEEHFEGQIMAGIQITKKIYSQDSTAITNKVGYILGLNLIESENPIKRKITLKNIVPKVSFGKTSVVATIVNPTMEAYGNLKYKVDIMNDSGENIRNVTYDEGMQLAPNSTYGLAIDWAGKPLIAGKYKMNLTITDAKDNKWEFHDKFEITKKQATEINKVTVDLEKTQKFPSMILFLIIFFSLVLFLIYLYFRKKNK